MKPQVMGILNVTEDSFYDGGEYAAFDQAVERGKQMISEGADWIDVGGESTRPGSQRIPLEIEKERVIPVIQSLKKISSTPLSIDTTKPQIAATAIDAGASMINDISGFSNPEMIEVAASYDDVRLCVMHMRGDPETMQINLQDNPNIVDDLLSWFHERIDLLLKASLSEKNILIDPGIGFGKTVADNLKIIDNLQRFGALGFPLLLGVSRKSFLSKIVGKAAKQLLAPTLTMNVLAILKGVDIIRIHDVQEHRDVVDTLMTLGKIEK